jgi:hypothetical protein
MCVVDSVQILSILIYRLKLSRWDTRIIERVAYKIPMTSQYVGHNKYKGSKQITKKKSYNDIKAEHEHTPQS